MPPVQDIAKMLERLDEEESEEDMVSEMAEFRRSRQLA